jgi:hypothetical protein
MDVMGGQESHEIDRHTPSILRRRYTWLGLTQKNLQLFAELTVGRPLF